ncbi:hypothetical protein B0I35DRAFT_491143 [Stachybotrys elegans]|uniref:Uncharacterized protein n=1 Tax=Stachybotrys elegans TaxID=80388 RepID=A0A8K0WND3_9HYPO|nr:hypothetical protein B0I35DRAFT_491143 [Stachybotrys elegans]
MRVLFPFLLIAHLGLSSASTIPFGTESLLQQYFPDYRDGFRAIIKHECTTAYCEYMWELDRMEEAEFYHINCNITEETYTQPSCINESDPDLNFDIVTGETCLVDCMLSHTPELVKFRMASAQVLLGLMLSLLALLAPATWKIGTIICVGRRPLLGFLFAVASPVVAPTFNTESSFQSFISRRDREHIRVPSWIARNLLSEGPQPRNHWQMMLQYSCWLLLYVLSMASAGNVAELAYRITRQSILTFNFGERWMLLFWVYSGLLPHALGVAAVCLRLKKLPPLAGPPGSENPITEGSIRPKPRFRLLSSSFVSIILSWIGAVCSVLHVTFGALMFSSILFLSVGDAGMILLRLFVSTVGVYSAVQLVIAIDRRRTEVVLSEESERPKSG